jgi:hypothetical protein
MPSLAARVSSMKLTSASWLIPVCGGFHNLILFNCDPFFASCRRHRVLTVTCLDACRCAAYLSLPSVLFPEGYLTEMLISCACQKHVHLILFDLITLIHLYSEASVYVFFPSTTCLLVYFIHNNKYCHATITNTSKMKWNNVPTSDISGTLVPARGLACSKGTKIHSECM